MRLSTERPRHCSSRCSWGALRRATSTAAAAACLVMAAATATTTTATTFAAAADCRYTETQFIVVNQTTYADLAQYNGCAFDGGLVVIGHEPNRDGWPTTTTAVTTTTTSVTTTEDAPTTIITSFPTSGSSATTGESNNTATATTEAVVTTTPTSTSATTTTDTTTTTVETITDAPTENNATTIANETAITPAPAHARSMLGMEASVPSSVSPIVGATVTLDNITAAFVAILNMTLGEGSSLTLTNVNVTGTAAPYYALSHITNSPILVGGVSLTGGATLTMTAPRVTMMMMGSADVLFPNADALLVVRDTTIADKSAFTINHGHFEVGGTSTANNGVAAIAVKPSVVLDSGATFTLSHTNITGAAVIIAFSTGPICGNTTTTAAGGVTYAGCLVSVYNNAFGGNTNSAVLLSFGGGSGNAGASALIGDGAIVNLERNAFTTTTSSSPIAYADNYIVGNVSLSVLYNNVSVTTATAVTLTPSVLNTTGPVELWGNIVSGGEVVIAVKQVEPMYVVVGANYASEGFRAHSNDGPLPTTTTATTTTVAPTTTTVVTSSAAPPTTTTSAITSTATTSSAAPTSGTIIPLTTTGTTNGNETITTATITSVTTIPTIVPSDETNTTASTSTATTSPTDGTTTTITSSTTSSETTTTTESTSETIITIPTSGDNVTTDAPTNVTTEAVTTASPSPNPLRHLFAPAAASDDSMDTASSHRHAACNVGTISCTNEGYVEAEITSADGPLIPTVGCAAGVTVLRCPTTSARYQQQVGLLAAPTSDTSGGAALPTATTDALPSCWGEAHTQWHTYLALVVPTAIVTKPNPTTTTAVTSTEAPSTTTAPITTTAQPAKPKAFVVITTDRVALVAALNAALFNTSTNAPTTTDAPLAPSARLMRAADDNVADTVTLREATEQDVADLERAMGAPIPANVTRSNIVVVVFGVSESSQAAATSFQRMIDGDEPMPESVRAVVLAAAATTGGEGPSNGGGGSDDEDDNTKYIIIGVVCGALAIFIIIALVVFVRRRASDQPSYETYSPTTNLNAMTMEMEAV